MKVLDKGKLESIKNQIKKIILKLIKKYIFAN